MRGAPAAPFTRKGSPNTSSNDPASQASRSDTPGKEVVEVTWLRKNRHADPEPSVEVVTDALRDAASRLLTGTIEFTCPAGQGRVFTFDGAPYAVDLPGFTPRLAARMHAAGWIGVDQLSVLAAEFPAASTQAGRSAVERGWIESEQLGELHQEYLLASLGGLGEASISSVHTDSGATTDRLCTIPVDAEGVIQTLRLRAERAAGTWAAMSIPDNPAQVVFRAHADLPSEMKIPEVVAVHGLLAVDRSVDDVGEVLGLTRAEATHILGALVAQGIVRHAWGVTPPTDGHLRVPEEFGATSSGA